MNQYLDATSSGTNTPYWLPIHPADLFQPVEIRRAKNYFTGIDLDTIGFWESKGVSKVRITRSDEPGTVLVKAIQE